METQLFEMELHNIVNHCGEDRWFKRKIAMPFIPQSGATLYGDGIEFIVFEMAYDLKTKKIDLYSEIIYVNSDDELQKEASNQKENGWEEYHI
jgi:hypothetical protein